MLIIILYRILQILVQSLGAGERWRWKQQRQTEDMQLSDTLLCPKHISQFSPLVFGEIRIISLKPVLRTTILIIPVRILYFTVLVSNWSCIFHQKNLLLASKKHAELNLRRLINPRIIFKQKNKKADSHSLKEIVHRWHLVSIWVEV